MQDNFISGLGVPPPPPPVGSDILPPPPPDDMFGSDQAPVSMEPHWAPAEYLEKSEKVCFASFCALLKRQFFQLLF